MRDLDLWPTQSAGALHILPELGDVPVVKA
jgi:hypothetical protein